ncbi:MAG: glycosyltransferase family 2 protein [Clostridia bacterium]|nr:glycosyltransferase family 2 protein [Clostridia bacterium]
MENIKPQKENICAVFVTYHPDEGIHDRVLRVLRQVGSVVIVDNGSSEEKVSRLREISAKYDICCVIENTENLGIATALNQGVQWAKAKGFQWALLMDQDSLVEDFMIETLTQVYDDYKEPCKISVIGSNYTHSGLMHLGAQHSPVKEGRWEEKKSVITSGSLISIPVFDGLGGFRDEFFIDHVDDEYCLRSWHKGYKVVLALKPTMVHSLGNVTIHKFMGRKLAATNHSAMRRYYMTRNHIVLMKEYFIKEFAWVRKTAYIRFVAFILICLFEKDKWKKLKAVIKGLIHGIFNLNMKNKLNRS